MGTLDCVKEKFFPSGPLEYSHPREGGVPHGIWVEFYEHGVIYSIGYKRNFRKIGLWQYFYPSGQIMKRGVYEEFDETDDWQYFGPDGAPDTLKPSKKNKDI